MKSRRFLPPVIVLIALAYAPVAMARSLTITNNTSYTMTQLYASSTYHSSDWGSSANLLTSGQSIGPGQSSTITISDGTSYCHYDFMAVLYGAAQAAYDYTVDTCAGGQWNISQN